MIALGLLVALALSPTLLVASASKTETPAVWSQYALIVDLQHLPKRYTCDELWYKFRDVLLAIGARSDLKVLPYRCQGRTGSVGFSPKVQLEFSLPSPVSGKNARLADLYVVTKPIRLEPGSVEHLDDSDCALLDQVRETLLTALHVHVTDFRLSCQAPPASQPPFGLTVRVAIPDSRSSSDVMKQARSSTK